MLDKSAAWTPTRVERRTPSGELSTSEFAMADEIAVGVHLNEQPVVVTMASPTDLEDLAVGFLFSEGYLEVGHRIEGVETYEKEQGVVVNVHAPQLAAVAARERSVVARASCGLCGVTSLADALVELEGVSRQPLPTSRAIHAAVGSLRERQSLNRHTRAVHGAAWCKPSGEITRIREDIGRHNALDKLLGARVRAVQTSPGFVFLTSRLSYELVQKAAMHNVATLVAVSAPTTLAVNMADRLGINLVAIARDDNHSIFTGYTDDKA